MSITIYGDHRSGNCLKVRWVCERLGLPYRWVEVDVVAAQTRTPEFLARNPAGQVPAVELEDGRTVAQSNGIMLHLAERAGGAGLIPADPYDRARMYEWLFWEQYSHETAIAVARFQMAYLGKRRDEMEPRLFERGEAALERMETALAETDWLVGDGLTLADIALVAYTRVAHEGGFDLAGYPAVKAWIARVERELGIG
jgi:glutathione S-transferase